MQNVKIVLAKEDWSGTAKLKIKYQTNAAYLKKREDKILEQQNDRNLHFKDLLRSYINLEKRLKTLEEKTDKKQLDYS